MNQMVTGVRYVRNKSGRCDLQVRVLTEDGRAWMTVRHALELGILPRTCFAYAKQYTGLQAAMARCELMESLGLEVPDGVCMAYARAKRMSVDRTGELCAKREKRRRKIELQHEIEELERKLLEHWERYGTTVDASTEAVRTSIQQRLLQARKELEDKPSQKAQKTKVARPLSDVELRKYRPGIFGVFKPSPVNRQARDAVRGMHP